MGETNNLDLDALYNQVESSAPQENSASPEMDLDSLYEASSAENTYTGGKVSGFDYDHARRLVKGSIDPINNNLEKIYAQNQSGIEQFGAAVNQAVVGEVLGGTIEGIGHLVNIDDTLNLMKEGELGTGNTIANVGQSLKEWTKEATPIHQNYEPGQFRPDKWSWWMTNAPSVASTLSLMLPAGAVTKGLSYLGKGSKLASQFSKTGKLIAKGTTQAVVSRQMENMMESAGTYESTLSSLMSQGVSHNKAVELAGAAAADNYKANWAMLAQDILQYTTLTKPFGKATSDLSVKAAKKLGKDVTPVITNKLASIGSDMVGEAAEEGYQYIAGERAREMAEYKAGLRSKRGLGEAVGDYMGDGDFWTGAFFGALGAGFMQTAGKGLNLAKERVRDIENADTKRMRDIDSWGQSIQGLGNLDATGEAMGTPSFNAKNRQLAQFGNKLAQNGNLGWFLETADNFQNMSEEDQQMFGFTQEELKASKEQFPTLKQDLQKIGDIYEGVVNNKTLSPMAVDMLVQEQFIADKTLEQYNKENGKYSSDVNNITGLSNLNVPSSTKDLIIKEKLELNNLLKVRKDLKSNNASSEVISEYDSRIKELREEIKEDKKNLSTFAEHKYKTFNNRATDFQAASSSFRKKEFLSAEHKSAMEAVDYFSNPENTTELNKKVAETQKEHAQEASDNATTAQEVNNIQEEAANIPTPETLAEDSDEVAQGGAPIDLTNMGKKSKDPKDLLSVQETFEGEGQPEIAPTASAVDLTSFNKKKAKQQAEEATTDLESKGKTEYKDIVDAVENKYSGKPHLLNEDINKILNYVKKGVIKDFSKEEVIELISDLKTIEINLNSRNEEVLKNVLVDLYLGGDIQRKLYDKLMDIVNSDAKEASTNKSIQATQSSMDSSVTTSVGTNEEKSGISISEINKETGQRRIKDNSVPNFAATNEVRYTDKKTGKEVYVSTKKLGIDQEALNNGKVKIGDKITFRINKEDSFDKKNRSNSQIRGFDMVSNGIIVGKVPSEFSVKSEVEKQYIRDLREVLQAQIESKYDKSKKYVEADFASKVAGALYDYTKSESTGTPSEVISKKDQVGLKSVGGFALDFIELKGDEYYLSGKSGLDNLNINIEEKFTQKGSSKIDGGLILTVPHPIEPNEHLFLRGFLNSLSQIEKNNPDLYNGITSGVIDLFNKHVSNKSKRSETKDSIKEIILRDFEVKGDNIVLSRRDNSTLVLPIDRLTENPEFLNWLGDSKIRIDKNKLNQESERHIIGNYESPLMPYNSIISDMISMTTIEGQYLNNVRILAERSDLTSQPKPEIKPVSSDTNIKERNPLELTEDPSSIEKKVEEKPVNNPVSQSSTPIKKKERKSNIDSKKIKAVGNYRGLPVKESNNIITGEGTKGAAKYDRVNNEILVDRSVLKKLFDVKKWTNPRDLVEKIHGEKIVSKVVALPENQFKTYEEFEKFVIEHEYQHSLLSRKEFNDKIAWKTTKGDYETEINNLALKELYGKKESKPSKKTFNTIETKTKLDNSQALKDQIRNNKNNTRYRSISDIGGDNWNKSEEMSWMKKNFPNVPVSVLGNLQEVVANGRESWGVFHNAAIYVAENAASGTLYHEAFHALFHLFNNQNQREALLKEASSRYSINKSKYDSVEDYNIALEEAMANEFMEYIVLDEAPKSLLKKVGESISNFFKKIQSVIKSLYSNPTYSIDELFWRGNNGFYNKSTIDPGSFSDPVSRYRVKDWSNRQEKQAIAAVNGHMVTQTIPSIRKANTQYSNLSDTDIINEVGLEDVYLNTYNDFVRTYNTDENLTQEEKDNIAELLVNLYEDGEFKDLYNGLLRGLEFYDIKIDFKSYKAEDVGRFDAEDAQQDDLRESDEKAQDKLESVSDSATERSTKDNALGEIKVFIRNMKIPGSKNIFGLNALVDYQETYDTLLKNLAGTTHIEDMMDMLNQDVVFHPEYQQILDMFEVTPEFKTKFFNAFNKNHTKYNIVSYINGNWAVYQANRKGLSNTIISQWTESILNNKNVISINSKGETIVNPEVKKIVEDIRENITNTIENWSSDKDVEYYKPLSESISKLGIAIDPKVLYYLGSTNNKKVNGKGALNQFFNTTGKFHYILDKFYDLKNPFDAEGGLSTGESEAIKTAANIVAKASPDLYESSFRNLGGKTVYAHLEQNFLTKLTHKLQNPNRRNDILDNYKKDQFFYTVDVNGEKVFTNRILKGLQSGKSVFDIMVTEGITDDQGNKTAYQKLDSIGLSLYSVHNYFNNNNKTEAWYRGPVLSDAPNGVVFKHLKSKRSDVLNSLVDLAGSEYNRIKSVKKQMQSLDKSEHIKNYHTKENSSTDTGYHIVSGMRGNSFDPNKERSKTSKVIEKWLLDQANTYFNFMKNEGVLDRLDDRLKKKYSTEESLRGFIQDFYINDFAARAEFSLMTTADPAFYKAFDPKSNNKTVDFVKRAKEIYSPKSILDIEASFKDSDTGETIKVGGSYRTVYLKDNEIQAPSFKEIEKAINKVKSISSQKKKEILASYGEVNQTDAQAYVTLPFYRKTMIGMGSWTQAHQEAYKRLEKGLGTGSDIALMMQPLKPFAYGQIYADKIGRLVPVQNKNSEYLLLPQMVKGNEKLENLYNYLIDNKIDSANFDSAVKAGLSKVIDPNALPEFNKDQVHVLNMEDRGIQQEVPEHFVDSNNLFGTQIRKLIMSDLFEGTTYFNGKSAKELRQMYEDILIADIEEAFDETAKEFRDKNGNIKYKEVYDLLLDESRKRGKGEEFEKAIQYDEKNDRLKLPLYNPITSRSAQNLITSVFKTRITKQKIAGGAFVQLSGYGLSKELKLVFDTEENRIAYEESGKGIDKSTQLQPKAKGLQYAEVMLPAWSKSFFKDFMNESGDVDFEAIKNKVPEALEMIGYRIPTEDKYSMLPMKVIGFLPYTAGGAIMLPAEITKISGSDFDVDKMYVMMKSFNDKLEIHKYDDEKSAKENSKKARDNRKIDLMMSVLRNPETLEAIMSGGTFKPLQDIAEITLNKIGKADRGLDPISLMSMDRMHKDNMTGKSMVGIAANENAFHAIAQHADLSLSKSVNFDKSNLTSLSNTEAAAYFDLESLSFNNKIKQRISKNKAYYLAAIVDNAKDPVASYINYNSYTSGIVGLLTQVGLDPATVTWFLKQPVIQDITDKFFASGEDYVEESNIIDKYKEEFGITSDPENAPNLNTKELLKNLNKSTTDKSQKEVLEAFLVYKDMAKDWTALVLASRADTKGFGPTLADSESIVHAISKVKEDDFSISGAKDLFDINSDKYRLVAAFTEYGINKPLEIVNKMFPYADQTGLYMLSKDLLSNFIKNRELSVKERNVINDQITAYLLSKFNLFNPNDRSYYLNKFPKEFLEFSEKNSTFADNYLVRRLLYQSSKSDKNTPIERIVFNNTGSLNNEQKNDIQKAWLDLYESPESRDMAEKLFKYTYFTTGMSFGANGFSHLMPVDLLTDNGIKDNNSVSLADFMWELQDNNISSGVNATEFIDQFYRNNYKSKAFVPRVNEESTNVDETHKNSKGEVIGFTVTPKVKDSSFIVKSNNQEIVYSKFISYENKDKSISLYENRSVGPVATYVLTNKLGFPNHVFEYLQGSATLTSSLDINNVQKYTVSDVLGSKGPVKKVSPATNFTDGKKEATLEGDDAGKFDKVSTKLNPTKEYILDITYRGKEYSITQLPNNKIVDSNNQSLSYNSPKAKLFRDALELINKKTC